MSFVTFDHHCLNKSHSWMCPACHFPSFLNNGFHSCLLIDENIYNSLALNYDSDDRDANTTSEYSFNKAPNAASTSKCNNKNTKSIYKTMKLCALTVIVYEALISVLN